METTNIQDNTTECDALPDFIDDILKYIFQMAMIDDHRFNKEIWNNVRLVCRRWKSLAKLSNMITGYLWNI